MRNLAFLVRPYRAAVSHPAYLQRAACLAGGIGSGLRKLEDEARLL